MPRKDLKPWGKALYAAATLLVKLGKMTLEDRRKLQRFLDRTARVAPPKPRAKKERDALQEMLAERQASEPSGS